MKLLVHKYHKIGFILSLWIFASCSPAYVPNVVNTPLLSNKKEIQASLYSGVSGFDLQSAYALTDHIGIMANGSFINNRNDSLENFRKHNFGELGVGYFSKIGNNGRFEVFSGYGTGKVQAEFENNLWQSDAYANYSRIFIQPSVGAATDYFDGAFSPRFVMVKIQQNNEHFTEYFAEPTLTGKVGYKYVKAVLQFGISIPMTEYPDFNYNPFLLSLGIQAYLNRVFDY